MADAYMDNLAALAELEPQLLVRFLEEAAAQTTSPQTWGGRLECLQQAIDSNTAVVASVGSGPEKRVVNYVQMTATSMAYAVAGAAGERNSEEYTRAWHECCRWQSERAAELLAAAEARILNVARPGRASRPTSLADPS